MDDDKRPISIYPTRGLGTARFAPWLPTNVQQGTLSGNGISNTRTYSSLPVAHLSAVRSIHSGLCGGFPSLEVAKSTHFPINCRTRPDGWKLGYEVTLHLTYLVDSLSSIPFFCLARFLPHSTTTNLLPCHLVSDHRRAAPPRNTSTVFAKRGAQRPGAPRRSLHRPLIDRRGGGTQAFGIRHLSLFPFVRQISNTAPGGLKT